MIRSTHFAVGVLCVPSADAKTVRLLLVKCTVAELPTDAVRAVELSPRTESIQAPDPSRAPDLPTIPTGTVLNS